MNALTERFEALAQDWERHCAAHGDSSNPQIFVEDPSFESLVALGTPALPLIIERYRTGSLFWGAALARITGHREFGSGLVGNLEQTRRQWLAWWEAQAASVGR